MKKLSVSFLFRHLGHSSAVDSREFATVPIALRGVEYVIFEEHDND
jgi:hypothetical protein